MEDFGGFDAHGIGGFNGALVSEASDTDDFFGFQYFQYFTEVFGAGIEQ